MAKTSRRAFLRLLAAAPVAAVLVATVGAEEQPEPAAEPQGTLWIPARNPGHSTTTNNGVTWTSASPITEEQRQTVLRRAASRSGLFGESTPASTLYKRPLTDADRAALERRMAMLRDG